MSERPDTRVGGLAAVLAHPDDESFSCAGALALAHDAGRVTRLLVATRGEAGTATGEADESLGDLREEELRCAAATIGLDEVTLLEGYPDGGIADRPFAALVDEITAWLADRRPDALITFGAHGVTGNPDHVVIGSATRWAVERLAEAGMGPAAVYVVAPVFGPGARRYDLSAEEGARDASDRRDRRGRAQGRGTGMPHQPARRGSGGSRACRPRSTATACSTRGSPGCGRSCPPHTRSSTCASSDAIVRAVPATRS